MPEMLYGKIPYVDKPVSRIVQGTVIIPEEKKGWLFQLLDGVFALGVNTFDTAANYGICESLLGEWVDSRQLRDRVVIITKGGRQNQWRSRRITSFDIQADFHDSLAKLRTDYVDIYILHIDNPETPAGPIVEVLNRLHDSGRLGAFGGSNWTHRRIAEANEYAYKYGLMPFIVANPNYSLAEQVEDPWIGGCVTLSGPENREAREWYRENQMPVFAYSSLARGFFSGRIKSTEEARAAEIFDKPTLKGYCHPVNFRRLERVEILAAEKGMTVPQVALAWIMHQPLNLFPLIGAMSPEEMAQNIAALHMPLTDTEAAWLNLERDAR